jgi:hypothetical protein
LVQLIDDRLTLNVGEVYEMAGTILNVMFKYNVTSEQLLEALAPLVDDFAKLPGLQWKIWFMNEEESEAGGVYLFENQAACSDYLSGPLARIVTSHPALSDFIVKSFDVLEEPTAACRGPVGAFAHG